MSCMYVKNDSLISNNSVTCTENLQSNIIQMFAVQDALCNSQEIQGTASDVSNVYLWMAHGAWFGGS